MVQELFSAKNRAPATREEVLHLLTQLAIPTHLWGKGEAQTVDKFVEEVLSGEAELAMTPDHRLERIARGSKVDVYYLSDAGLLRLVEDRQEFRDGRRRHRRGKIDFSVGEKCKRNESAENAAYRALEEELGVTEPLPLEALGEEPRKTTPSLAYPGTITTYISTRFRVMLPAQWYKQEGYVERQNDKSTYFVWEPTT
ncbi:MAG: NUDIX domain-containing protein [bacterium]|nr:NUDIX domain-containing protein [bacterium]